MASAPVVVKCMIAGTNSIQRHRAQTPLTLEKLQDIARRALGRNTKDITIKYEDDEQDHCTLLESTFEDFEVLHQSKPVVRLHLATEGKGPNEPDRGCPLPPASAFAGPCVPSGPKPLLLALRYLCSGSVDGWTAENASVLILAFLPMLRQRAAKKKDKLNKQGAKFALLAMPALRALEREIQTREAFSGLRPFLARLLTGQAAELGSFLCALFAALHRQPFSEQKAITAAVLPELVAGCPELLAKLRLFCDAPEDSGCQQSMPQPQQAEHAQQGTSQHEKLAVQDSKPCLDGEAMGNPEWHKGALDKVEIQPSGLLEGMKLWLKSASGLNLRIKHDGSVDKKGLFGAFATFNVRRMPEMDTVILQNDAGLWLRCQSGDAGVLDAIKNGENDPACHLRFTVAEAGVVLQPANWNSQLADSEAIGTERVHLLTCPIPRLPWHAKSAEAAVDAAKLP